MVLLLLFPVVYTLCKMEDVKMKYILTKAARTQQYLKLSGNCEHLRACFNLGPTRDAIKRGIPASVNFVGNPL